MLQKAAECTIDSDKEKMYIDKIKGIAEEETSLKDLVLTILARKGTHAIVFLRSYKTFTSFYTIWLLLIILQMILNFINCF